MGFQSSRPPPICSPFSSRVGHPTDYIDEYALPDRMVSFAGNIAVLFILCHPHRLKIFRRVFTIFGTVLLMRAVSVSVTVLPDASPVCRERFEVSGVHGNLGITLVTQFIWRLLTEHRSDRSPKCIERKNVFLPLVQTSIAYRFVHTAQTSGSKCEAGAIIEGAVLIMFTRAIASCN